MFWDEEITQEEEEEIIEWIAREFYKYGLETAGIMFLESLKPISRYGSSMGQIFISPMLPILGDNLMMKGDKAMRVFERDENVEKLIQRLEDMAVNGIEDEKETKEEPSNKEDEEVVTEEKKGWRRYLPF
ncbi:hypothetical protein KQH65_04925 [archaeon]|nr:hypothetical protein [archaeon]